MNWIYILFHSKSTERYIKKQKEIIHRLHQSLYGDREWEIEKINGNILKVMCPCLTEANETNILNGGQFISIEYTCPRCKKKFIIPKFNEQKCLFIS
jgi:hypothetical protein